MMKYFLLSVFLVFSQFGFPQSKKDYLENNRYDLQSPEFNFPEKDFKIMGFGAYHGSQKTEEVELVLVENLLKKAQILYYFPETDFGIAYYFNQYLYSGDTLLLKDLVKHYGRRVPQDRSIATYNKWKEIKRLNDLQADERKMQVLGIDLLVTYKYTAKLLTESIHLQPGALESYDKLVEMLKLDTTDYSPDYDSYSKALMKDFVNDFDSQKVEYGPIPRNEILIKHLIKNIKLTFERRDREKSMFENYSELSAMKEFGESYQFFRLGFFHLEKAREGNYPSFFTRLIENELYKPDQIISVVGFLTKSQVLWSTKYDDSGNYIGKKIEGGYGIGDYWKEYFKGIRQLKKTKLSDLTLYQLNAENSPYLNGQTDLMEIKLFLKKSNKDDLEGKTTTDYMDYGVLIRNSAASQPIEELGK